MASQILIKRSTTAGAVPTTSDIATGELALNTTDKRIFTNNEGTIVELGTTPTTQAVTGNASVGGTFDVVGQVSVDNFTATGDVVLTAATTTVAAPTADNHAATKKYVDDEVNAILDGAPAALDTLNEIAAAINDDANLYTTLTNSIATKLSLSGGTMTGSIDMGTNKVTSSTTPTSDSDLTRKGYVDGLYQSTVDAEDSATAAAASATSAANSASSASTSASTASTQASNASSSATAAASSATSASNSATSATNSATASASSATASANSASAASTSETNAATSETNAATSASNAATSESNAATSATTATTQAGIATTKASEASASASSAATSESNASTSETNAANSATAAATSATQSASSATASANSASAASTSETNAANSATAAAVSEANAATSEANAAATLAGAVQASGDTMTGNLNFGDNDKAVFGAGDGLQIYHDGTYTRFIDSGITLFRSDDWRLQSQPGAEQMIRAVGDGAVSLSYNNEVKLDTTSTGLDVTGTVTADGLTVDGDVELKLWPSTGLSNTSFKAISLAGGDINYGAYIYVDQGALSSQHGLSFRTSNQALPTNALKIHQNNDISFYEDTGTTPKFFWDASAESLGIGTSSPTRKLEVYDATAAHLNIKSSSTGIGYLNFGDADDDNSGRVAYANSDDSMQFFTDAIERMHIDSSGNVGIGTTPDSSSKLHVRDDVVSLDRATLHLETYVPTILFEDISASTVDHSIQVNSGSLSFRYGNYTEGNNLTDEAMRIDSSGNLLVGQSSSTVPGAGNTTLGHAIRADGGALFSRAGGSNATLYVNKNTDDGAIVDFRKDGSTVGSIGSAGGTMYLGSSDTGLQFSSNVELVAPWNPSTNAVRDNAISLGYSAGRFKDLYLSGGVYLGGTGAANKLDDYETGTWTPAFVYDASTTYTSQSGRYIKVGSIVHATGTINVASRTDDASTVHITLPFAVATTATAVGCTGNVDVNTSTFLNLSTNGSAVIANVSGSANVLRILKANGNNITYTSCAASGVVRFGITYETDA